MQKQEGWTNTEIILKRGISDINFVLTSEAAKQNKNPEILTSSISDRVNHAKPNGVLSYTDLYNSNLITKEEYVSTKGWTIGYNGAAYSEIVGPIVGATSTYIAGQKGLLNQGNTNNKKEIRDISDLSSEAKNKISTSQKATLNQQKRLCPHLTEDDFTGATKELNGIPLKRADGTLVLKENGNPYNHMQEFSDTYRALEKFQKSYTGILKNPNLDLELKQLYTNNLYEVETNMRRINDVFAPFGGILPPK